MASIFASIVILVLGILCIGFGLLLLKRLNLWSLSFTYGAKLPPGSLGLPYIGETLQLFSQDPNAFFSTRQKRYGDIFKTHILGCPCIMLASPEAVKFALMTKASLFKPTYPKSKERLIGSSAIFFQQGPYHAQIRRLVQLSLSLDNIKPLVPKVEAIAKSTLDSWADGRVVRVFRELKKFTFDVAVLSIFGELDSYYSKILKENYITLDKDDQIIDNIIGVLFAAQDTTASMMTWILKYITNHPNILEQIQVEQMAIYKENGDGEQPLTWTHIREMQITHRVILESLRMASIISFTYREATQDVVYNGFLIPKGWKVLPLFRNIHYNPAFFDNPQTFDASRFESATAKPHTFMPFGYGAHACPGNEVAKLLMHVFIHHLVTHFRWKLIGPQGGVVYDPFPVPEQGLPAKFWKTSPPHAAETCIALKVSN